MQHLFNLVVTHAAPGSSDKRTPYEDADKLSWKIDSHKEAPAPRSLLC